MVLNRPWVACILLQKRCALQLYELEQLVNAMNEMAATAMEVANNAQGAASAAKDADDATKEGSKVVGIPLLPLICFLPELNRR